MDEHFTEQEYNNATSHDTLFCKCAVCSQLFGVKKKYITFERKHKEGEHTFCSRKCYIDYKTRETKIYNCLNCGKSVKRPISACSPTNFCGHSCRATYLNKQRKPRTLLTKNRVSNSLIKTFNKQEKRHTRIKRLLTDKIVREKCPICANHFTQIVRIKPRKTCSSSCMARYLNSMKIKSKRSKKEIILHNLCLTYFKKVEANKQIMNGWDSDIVINTNILVFWNGPWHYRNMNIKGVSLKQIQKRDEIKLNKFLDAGYKVFIYEDRFFTPEKAFEDLKSVLTVGDLGIEPNNLLGMS